MLLQVVCTCRAILVNVHSPYLCVTDEEHLFVRQTESRHLLSFFFFLLRDPVGVRLSCRNSQKLEDCVHSHTRTGHKNKHVCGIFSFCIPARLSLCSCTIIIVCVLSSLFTTWPYYHFICSYININKCLYALLSLCEIWPCYVIHQILLRYNYNKCRLFNISR